jgi:hypothetical protein
MVCGCSSHRNGSHITDLAVHLWLNFAVGDNPHMVKPSSQLTVRNYGAAHGRHSHDYFQVLWTLDGCLELEVEGKGLA